MCALSEGSTELVREAMAAARRHRTRVSFDCNYRPSLWKSRGGRAGSVAVNRSLMEYVDVLFGHEGDVAAVLGESSHGPVWHTLESFGPMAERVMGEFPQLKAIASTVRRPVTANRNGWSAFAYAKGEAYEGLSFPELEIFDRVGGGDSFAAGVSVRPAQGQGRAVGRWTAGVASGALAMTTPGDSQQATLGEIERLMGGGHAGTVR